MRSLMRKDLYFQPSMKIRKIIFPPSLLLILNLNLILILILYFLMHLTPNVELHGQAGACRKHRYFTGDIVHNQHYVLHRRGGPRRKHRYVSPQKGVGKRTKKYTAADRSPDGVIPNFNNPKSNLKRRPGPGQVRSSLRWSRSVRRFGPRAGNGPDPAYPGAAAPYSHCGHRCNPGNTGHSHPVR